METRQVSIDAVDISTFNVRKNLMDGQQDSSIADLAQSISIQGLLNPIIVFAKENQRYGLVAGQRRLLACKRLGWKTVPAIIHEKLTDAEATAISLVENIHRADMNPMDKARALKVLLDKHGDLAGVSRETGIGTATIRKYIHLLNLAPQLQQKLAAGEARNTEALARLAQRFTDPDQQAELWSRISGFNQDVQQQIIKGADSDLSNIEGLVGRAAEGALNARVVQNCPFDCPTIPRHLKAEVARLIESRAM